MSTDLTQLFLSQKNTKIAIANDTSCGVGYAPLNTLENLVIKGEHYLNSSEVKTAFPAIIGEDIKVMGVRSYDEINLTVACAIVGCFIKDMPDYLEIKQKIAELAQLAAKLAGVNAVNVMVNVADNIAEENIYLTVTGTSAENGDDGEVGRGNRANGLISFYRPMSMEALAGKNPVSHIGKLYNVLAQNIAHDIVNSVKGVLEVYCYLLGQIGRPIDNPAVADLKLHLAPGINIEQINKPVAAIVHQHLASINTLW